MKCEKCGYESEENKKISNHYLCSVCSKFAPENLEPYLQEKINGQQLESFRKYDARNILGMKSKAEEGKIMSRAPLGYKIINKEIAVDEEKRLIVEQIFRKFLEQEISLNQLAKDFNFSVNGIKKVLKNFTYIGKIKFKGQILQGKHPGIVPNELFNKVQNKLENR